MVQKGDYIFLFSSKRQEPATKDTKHLILSDIFYSLKLLINRMGCLVRFGLHLFLIKQAKFLSGVDVSLVWKILLEFLKRQSLLSFPNLCSFIILRRHVLKYVACGDSIMVDIVNLSNLGFSYKKTGILWEKEQAVHRLLKLAYFYRALRCYCHILFLLQSVH